MSFQGSGIADFVKPIGDYYQKAVDYGIVDVILHPLDYADILIRLGYEPFPPLEESSPFRGSKSLVLPGVFTYVHYLYTIDGVYGLFRGVVPYVSGNLIYRHLSAYILNRAPIPMQPPEGEPRLCERFTEENINHFFQTRCWKMFSNVVAVHAAYPFQVIAIRTMARFVTSSATKEGYRPEISESWIDELFRIRSFHELFAGCGARLVKEVMFAIIAGSSFLLLMKVAQLLKADPLQADQLEKSLDFLGNTIAAVYVNPFRNISDIMIINSMDIPLGNPPFNEKYSSCWDCFTKLRKDRKWKTSSAGSLFHSRRYYNGPVTEQNGKLIPQGNFFGPVYLPVSAKGMEDVPYFLKGYYHAWKEFGGVERTGKVGFVNKIIEEGVDTRRRSGSVPLLNEMKSAMMEQAPIDILGLNSKSFYLYGSSSNPFGL